MIEALKQKRKMRERRALVSLDDYIGTSSQFLFQFIGRSNANTAVLENYQCIRLCSLVVHDDSRTK